MNEAERYKIAGEILSGSCTEGLEPHKGQQLADRIVAALRDVELGIAHNANDTSGIHYLEGTIGWDDTK